MNLLDQQSDEKLSDFLCCNKAKISTIKDPWLFLNQLNDNKLITEQCYQVSKKNINIIKRYYMLRGKT